MAMRSSLSYVRGLQVQAQVQASPCECRNRARGSRQARTVLFDRRAETACLHLSKFKRR